MTIEITPTLAALSALAMLAAVPAFAEDASAEWTGTYVGGAVAAGYLTTDQYSPPQSFLSYGYSVPTYAGWHPYGGIHAGLDHQVGQIVVGLRLQHAVTGSGPDTYLKVDELMSANAVALTTLSARAGYLVQPDLLGYVSASAVAGHFKYASVDERWGQVDDNLDAIRAGWGIGGGFEFRLTDDISVFTEYTHVRFPTASSTFDYGPTSSTKAWTYDFTHSLSIVQAGINFRF